MVSWWRRIKISAVLHVSSRWDSRSHVATRVISVLRRDRASSLIHEYALVA